MHNINTKLLGQQAEDLAVKYLQNNKYQILGRNYSRKCGEIDIIAFKQDAIVFIEVRSLSSETIKYLEQSLNNKKLLSLYKICNFWLYEHGRSNENWRLDYLGICREGGIIKRFKHIENIGFRVGSVAQW